MSVLFVSRARSSSGSPSTSPQPDRAELGPGTRRRSPQSRGHADGDTGRNSRLTGAGEGRGRPASTASDLGVLAYYCLAGAPRFTEHRPQAVAAHNQRPIGAGAGPQLKIVANYAVGFD